jgi:hypothetical protein
MLEAFLAGATLYLMVMIVMLARRRRRNAGRKDHYDRHERQGARAEKSHALLLNRVLHP